MLTSLRDQLKPRYSYLKESSLEELTESIAELIEVAPSSDDAESKPLITQLHKKYNLWLEVLENAVYIPKPESIK